MNEFHVAVRLSESPEDGTRVTIETKEDPFIAMQVLSEGLRVLAKNTAAAMAKRGQTAQRRVVVPNGGNGVG